jgi:hypothetical protein
MKEKKQRATGTAKLEETIKRESGLKVKNMTDKGLSDSLAGVRPSRLSKPAMSHSGMSSVFADTNLL